MSRKLRLRQKKWFSYKKKSMYLEYVLHQDYSTSTTLADEKCVNVVIEYVTKHGKHFDQDNSRKLTNIVTNSQIGHQSSTFFLSVEKMRTKTSTRLARLVDKTEKLFDTIPKTRTSKRSTSTIQTYDLKKEIVFHQI